MQAFRGAMEWILVRLVVPHASPMMTKDLAFASFRVQCVQKVALLPVKFLSCVKHNESSLNIGIERSDVITSINPFKGIR